MSRVLEFFPWNFCATQFLSHSLSLSLSFSHTFLAFGAAGFKILKNVFAIFQYLHFELNQFECDAGMWHVAELQSNVTEREREREGAHILLGLGKSFN